MKENVVSTPTRKRCVTSYAARTQYRPGEIRPPHIKVKDAINIHCHAKDPTVFRGRSCLRCEPRFAEGQ